MVLSTAQFARAAALEAGQARLQRLVSMSAAELRALLGRGPALAAPWIAGAAQGGLPAAQLCLGRMLLAGEGVPVDAAKAFRWFERAAEQGDAEAMNMLGRCLELGWGVGADPVAAARHYRRSAEAGHDWGEYNLGNLLFDGRGVREDRAQALRWYLRSARQGHGRAMNLVGRCLEEGWGCVARPAEAAYWYRGAAESGYFRGQFNHALILLQSGSYAAAAQWLWKAALGGNAEIRAAIAGLLERVQAPELQALAGRIEALLRELPPPPPVTPSLPPPPS